MKLTKGEPLPLCSELNENKFYTYDIGRHNALGLVTKIIIIRRFYTDACPKYAFNGQVQRLNAFIVQRLEKEEWLNHKVFMCSLSLRKKDKVPLRIIPGSGGLPEQETIAEAYRLDENYSVTKVFHDDRCGIGTRANAYIVEFVK